jgi:hypothetical protein
MTDTLRRRPTASIGVVALAIVAPCLVLAQTGGQPQQPRPPLADEKPPAIERIGPNLFRIGSIRVDVARREISVAGTVNPDVRTLEFIANGRGGLRAYETAVTVDTDGITFNAALLLIGLNRSRARNVPKSHFDPAVAEGDAVEIFLECPGNQCERMPAERLMYDVDAKQTAASGKWVYTGSAFLSDGRYMAQVDGTLVSFVHDPASIIEYATGAGLNRYGRIVFNPNLGLAQGTAVTLAIRAARPTAGP